MFVEFAKRCVGVALLAGLLVSPVMAQNTTDTPEPENQPAASSNDTDTGPSDRIAFVVGVGAYAQKPIANALNDAGLVAEALRSIGFEIVEGADPNQADFLRSYREFLDKVTAAGPDAVAFVYFSGYGFEFEGENYLALSDAKIERTSDIALGTVRLSDLVRPLGATPARAKLMALDAARPLPFTIPDRPLARGLAVPVPESGMLVGYSSAPGTVAEDRPGDYGPYAMAIAEMVRAPGVDLNEMFTQIRVRTHQATEGKQTPFHVTALKDTTPLVAKEDEDNPSDAGSPPPRQRVAEEDDSKPLKEVGPEKAYARTIKRDSLEGYDEYAEAYPESPYIQRIRALARARREALLWIRALEENTPEAFWTYLRRYPDGMYAADAEFRLRRLRAEEDPPQDFTPVEFADVPLPPAEEPEELFDELPAGPPPPVFLIGPPPRIFLNLRPPRGPRRPGFLPVTIRLPGLRPPRRPPRVGVRPPRPPRVGIRPPPGRRPPGVIGRLPRPPGARPPGQVRRPPGARPPGQVRRPPGARPPGQVRRPPQQTRRPPQVRRPPQQTRRPPPQVRRPPQQTRRPPPQVRRPPPQVRRPPQQVRRPPPQVRRPPPARTPTCRMVNGRRVCR
jgi:Caspase domain